MNTLASLLDSAKQGYLEGYKAAEAAGFPAGSIISKGSDARVSKVLDTLIEQYGSYELKGLPAVMISNRLVSESLYETVLAFEALFTASEETLQNSLSLALERYAESA